MMMMMMMIQRKQIQVTIFVKQAGENRLILSALPDIGAGQDSELSASVGLI